MTAPEPLSRQLGGCCPNSNSARPNRTQLDLGSDLVAHVLRRIGRRVECLRQEIAEIDRRLSALVAEIAPQLLAECGVGAVCAAQLVVSSGDPQPDGDRGVPARR